MSQLDLQPMPVEPVAPPEPVDLHALAWLPEEWRVWLESIGERPFRAQQIFRWLHRAGVLDAAGMTNLSVPLRERLAAQGVAPPLQVVEVRRSKDGTRKLLLDLDKGGRVECVLIPMTSERAREDADVGALDERADEEDAEPSLNAASPNAAAASPARQRVTLCISTQHGCAMGCVFCASGQAGLGRGLGPEEIVAQVLLARRYLEPDEDLRNLVFMGMGEPLHHYAATARALRLLTHPEGAGMSPRRITVSTVGLIPGIQKLGADFQGKIGLAVSLHAADDATRSRIIPMNRRYPFAELLKALRAYPLPNRRRITIEYTLIRDVNDSTEDAERLARELRGLPVKINLIPMNPIGASALRAPTRDSVRRFQEILSARAYSCFVRTRRGDEVDAACGQLALNGPLLRKGRAGLARDAAVDADAPIDTDAAMTPNSFAQSPAAYRPTEIASEPTLVEKTEPSAS